MLAGRAACPGRIDNAAFPPVYASLPPARPRGRVPIAELTEGTIIGSREFRCGRMRRSSVNSLTGLCMVYRRVYGCIGGVYGCEGVYMGVYGCKGVYRGVYGCLWVYRKCIWVYIVYMSVYGCIGVYAG